MLLRDRILLPELGSMDPDDPDRMAVHFSILHRKKMLLEVFREFHYTFVQLDKKCLDPTPGIVLELGAGVAPVRDSYPHVLATDVVADPRLDMQIDAEAICLDDRSVHAFYGQNCFHHFGDPDRFFAEASRVLQPGGGIVLIEPYFGPVASWIYPRLFASEGFDKSAATWRSARKGPMVGANQALSYLVFKRDRVRFERQFPQLKIVHQQPLTNYLRYLLSGGLNFQALVPAWASGAIRFCERLLSPAASVLALHHVIVIKRQ